MPSRILRKRTLDELLRDFDDRIARLERRTSIVIGTAPNSYVIETDSTGQLTARHATTGTVTVLALP